MLKMNKIIKIIYIVVIICVYVNNLSIFKQNISIYVCELKTIIKKTGNL